MKSFIVLLVLCSLHQGHAVGVVEGGCPLNFIRYYNSDRCYYISDFTSTSQAAKTHCETWKSELVPPLSCMAEVHLSGVLAADSYTQEFWIGVNKLDGDVWKTTRGTKVEESHQYWEEGYPKGDGKCAAMSFTDNWREGEWRNEDCGKELNFVCITCPDQYDYLAEVDQCVQLNLAPMIWNDAKKYCMRTKYRAHLASIENPVKQRVIKAYLENSFKGNETDACINADGDKTIWLGGQTADPNNCTSQYLWNQGMGYDDGPFNYTEWNGGTADCAKNNGNCVRISSKSEYKWEPTKCDASLCSLCEFD